MINKSFIEGQEYQAFKTILKDATQNKPFRLKTEGKTNAMIAREVTAYEMAAKMVEKAIKKFEKSVVMSIKEDKGYK